MMKDSTAKTRMIDITQDDINAARDSGKWHSMSHASHCPIAFALRRLYPAAAYHYAAADDCGAYTNSRTHFECETNARMLRFMRLWDERFTAQPTRFRVKVHPDD